MSRAVEVVVAMLERFGGVSVEDHSELHHLGDEFFPRARTLLIEPPAPLDFTDTPLPPRRHPLVYPRFAVVDG